MHDWFWKAILTDGEIIPQYNADDQEITFREVLNAETNDSLEMLVLFHEEKEFAVDVRTGLFYINGIPFDPSPQYTMQDLKYRIIYYKRVAGEYHLNTGEQEIKTLLYLLGWQVTIHNQNIQRIMFINSGNNLMSIQERR